MTLKSLGLNDGRAMLRLLHRDLTKLNTQAHVAGQLNSKSNKSNDNKPSKAVKKASNMAQNVTSQIKKALDPISMLKAEKGNDKNKNFPKSGGHKLGEGPSPSGATSGSTGALKNQKQQNISVVKEVFLYFTNYFHHLML